MLLKSLIGCLRFANRTSKNLSTNPSTSFKLFMLLSRLLQSYCNSPRLSLYPHPQRFVSMISISDSFDSGNISLKSIQESSNHVTTIDLHIKNEPFTGNEQKQHKQWFHFRASGVNGKACELNCCDAQHCLCHPHHHHHHP